MKQKIIAIVGHTATGKSELALRLAKKFNGDIISADSRTVYRGLDVGTAKPRGKWINPLFISPSMRGRKKGGRGRERHKSFVYKGVPHHLIDFLPLKKTFSAADFARAAQNKIAEIQVRGRLPIVCGGTGFWIDALLNPSRLAKAPPNPKLRARLEKLPVKQLFKKLQALDLTRAQNIDPANKRRLIRAVEIALTTCNSVTPKSYQLLATSYDVLFLGLTLPNAELKKRIRKRFFRWLKQGLVSETKKLIKKINRKRLAEIGLAYPIVADYLVKKISKTEMIERSVNSIYHYAKRQKTWFRKNKKIHWVKDGKEALCLIRQFLSSSKNRSSKKRPTAQMVEMSRLNHLLEPWVRI